MTIDQIEMTATNKVEATEESDQVNAGVPTNQSPAQYKNNLSELEYIKVSDAIELFNYLPTVLYIRGKVDTSDKTTSFYRLALTHNAGSQKFVNVQEPFTAFKMSAEEIDQSDLKGIIEPGKTYLLNGQNRFYNIAEMYTNSAYGKVNFNDIPVRYLNGILNRSFLDRFQVNANDTTLKHPTMMFMASVFSAYSNYIERKTIAELADIEADISVLPDKSIKAIETAANKYAQDAFNVSAQYMSSVKLLNSEATPEILWDLMNNGWVNYEAAKLLVQACKALKLNVEATLSDLIQEFDINQYVTTTNEDDKALITAPQVKKWRAAHEAAIKKAEKEEKAQTSDDETDDETDDSETDDETDDSETDDTTVGSAPSSQSGVVVPPIDTIPLKHVIHRAMGNLRTISRYSTVDPVQNHNLTLFNTALTKIAAKQIDNVSPEKAKIAFDSIYALVDLLLDDNCLSGMLPTDLQHLSVTFQSMNEKAQHVLIDDEVTEEDMNGVREDYEVPDDITEEAPVEIIETTLLAFQNFETDDYEEDEEEDEEEEDVETGE